MNKLDRLIQAYEEGTLPESNTKPAKPVTETKPNNADRWKQSAEWDAKIKAAEKEKEQIVGKRVGLSILVIASLIFGYYVSHTFMNDVVPELDKFSEKWKENMEDLEEDLKDLEEANKRL